ncbi:coiled-coil domain-containing protein 112-like [Montipora capricornis]|uniref:coiled-coil domain-containing protein 112-like n=1 Tax=Montipora foliosa TaxID=591990 RepID=UPI0035F20037
MKISLLQELIFDMNNRADPGGINDPDYSRQPKTLQQKKWEFFDKLEQLEQKLSALEKEGNALFYSKRSEFRKDYCELEELYLKGTNDRKTEKHKLKQQLSKIRTNISKFQRDLRDVKPSPEFVEKLKEIMEEIENSMMTFKEQQRKVYDEILQEECVYMQEVSAMEKKFDSWSQLPAPATAATDVKRAASAVTVSLPPAVAAFERFLAQTGGHQGGWDDYDHQLFLNLKSKHKAHDKFMRAAGTGIPGRSADDVRQHDEWYSEYLILKDSKKKAIRDWKDEKQTEKEALKDDDDEIEVEERRKKKREEQIQRERDERMKQLNEWKVQRELEKAKMEETRLRQDLNKAREREKEEKRRLEVKAHVEQYARQREEEQAILRAARQAREEQKKVKLTTEEVAKIQERSQKMLDEKQAKMKAKVLEKVEKEKRLQKLKSQVEVNVSRDPFRLYKLTAGWEQRKKEGPGTSGQGLTFNMPHRAVPSWRQGLS